MTSNPLELFRKFSGAVRANFWLCGSFLVPEKQGSERSRALSWAHSGPTRGVKFRSSRALCFLDLGLSDFPGCERGSLKGAKKAVIKNTHIKN